MNAARNASVALAQAPIGVFDSGVGGLTVLAALRATMPAEDFIYLGDTARLPYGTKSGETVVRYALQAADSLVERGVKALVVACNTASAVALPALRERLTDTPVLGVVEPGAAAAVAASRTGRIVVIGTEGTVRGGAYQRAIVRLRADASVTARACQLFVALAEEGWTEGEVALGAAHRYLDDLFGPGVPLAQRADVLVLGCTHFPALSGVLEQVAGAGVTLVDSARTTASAAQQLLASRQLLRVAEGRAGALQLLATDGIERFARVGSTFLKSAIDPREVQLVDL